MTHRIAISTTPKAEPKEMNTFKESTEPVEEVVVSPIENTTSTPKVSGKMARSVRTVLSGEFLTKESLINHLPFIGFLALLFFLHISLMYYFENTYRSIGNTERAIKELRSEYNTTMSILETKKQQSSVALDIEALGLKELRTPPHFIDVEPGFFEEEE